mmetsp:Transcript_47122/g.134470  ORF Transcript_47122/g.134470 Transcript_47122/m.134470 type:complete len:205 (+) Transcript_47122:2027-2641(+)
MHTMRPVRASKMSCADPSFAARRESIRGALRKANARPSPLGLSDNCLAKPPKTRKASGVAGPMTATTPAGQNTASTSSRIAALASARRSGSMCSASTRASCNAETWTCSWSRRPCRTRCTTWDTSPGEPIPRLLCSKASTLRRNFVGTLALGSTASAPAGPLKPGGAAVRAVHARRPRSARSPLRSSSGSRRLQLPSARLQTAS